MALLWHGLTLYAIPGKILRVERNKGCETIQGKRVVCFWIFICFWVRASQISKYSWIYLLRSTIFRLLQTCTPVASEPIKIETQTIPNVKALIGGYMDCRVQARTSIKGWHKTSFLKSTFFTRKGAWESLIKLYACSSILT